MILATWSLMLDNWKLDLAAALPGFGVLVAVYLLFTFTQRFLSRYPLLRSVGLQLNLLVLTGLVLLLMEPVLSQMHGHVRSAIKVAAVFLGVVISLKLTDVVFFEWLARRRKKPPMPLVVRDLARWGLSLMALVLIVRIFFPHLDLNVLAVSSLVVGYIVGNATQDTLGNLFAGLALNTERPFQIGDWVKVGEHIGVVVDTTWRATRLRTKAEDFVVIPNSSIARESIINFSRPTGIHACYQTVGVSYDTPPNKARQVILDVLRESPEVCKTPPPIVYLVGYGDFAINFTLKYFIEDYARIDPIQSGVMDRLWYAFRREEISIPFPVRDCRHRDAVSDDLARRNAAQEAVRRMLAGVELFQSLSQAEMNHLVNSTKLKLFARGENLCRQGEAGDSFYIIREGQVAVLVNNPAGQPVTVAHLGRDAFFGEMSLLTGEPRSGTVCAETDTEVLCVSKQDFANILQKNAGLAGQLAIILEKRMAERRSKMEVAAPTETVSETHTALAARILQFFGLE
jgi:small-conductance mechanosensitive channel/CRP-like cAMP-binding protein